MSFNTKTTRVRMAAIALVACTSMSLIPTIPASAAEADPIAPTSESGEYGIEPMWLNPDGKHTQHPAEGGTWEWGFWDAKIRSYYTHNSRAHRSSVSLNGDTVRSINTAAKKKSIAEKYAVNYWGNNDAYYYSVS